MIGRKYTKTNKSTLSTKIKYKVVHTANATGIENCLKINTFQWMETQKVRSILICSLHLTALLVVLRKAALVSLTILFSICATPGTYESIYGERIRKAMRRERDLNKIMCVQYTSDKWRFQCKMYGFLVWKKTDEYKLQNNSAKTIQNKHTDMIWYVHVQWRVERLWMWPSNQYQ
jgi:hypothetical protein